jgi:uncharacterized membrane protein YcaP (DUF421 family)
MAPAYQTPSTLSPKPQFLPGESIQGQLREQGVEDISKVKAAYIESDGRISVVEYEQTQHEKTEKKET